MRLIDVESRQLTFFATCTEVWNQYAILSHTWQEEEVTYQEFRDGTASKKKGYVKIMQTCDQARKDGLKYAWVDTCCINKESSAELSEAINSMWKYYSYAKVCYAFLSDVEEKACPSEMDDIVLIPDHHLPDYRCYACQAFWSSTVAKSRWFTRGWTLQELIAPENVVLFDSAWNSLGRKRNLVRSLANITGINKRVLQPKWSLAYVLAKVSIAEKMSWAAGRRTTHAEDRAYSLLGLFGIAMPLLYGEGEKAFVRLQEEIIKDSTDLSFLVHDPNAELESAQQSPLTRSLGPPSIQVRYHEMIFARTPDQFRHGGRVLQWQDDRFEKAFRLTNRGLEFNALCMTVRNGQLFGLLNCRLKDDLRGALAVRLSQGLRRSSWFRGSTVSGNDYWIDLKGGSTSPEQPAFSDVRTSVPGANEAEFDEEVAPIQPEVNSQIVVLPELVDSEIHEKPATILRAQPSWAVYYHDYYIAKFWLRVDQESDAEMQIVNAAPEPAWNLRTGVMLIGDDPFRSLSSTHFAGVRLEMLNDCPILVDIGFRYCTREHDHFLASRGHIGFKVSYNNDHRSLFDWVMSDKDYSNVRRFQQPSQGIELVITLKRESVLEERVCAIVVRAYCQNQTRNTKKRKRQEP